MRVGVGLAGDEFVAEAVDVHEFDAGVVAEVFAEFGDEDVHAAGVEVGVVAPDEAEGGLAFEDFALLLAEEAEEVGFAGGEALDLVLVAEFAGGEVEVVVA